MSIPSKLHPADSPHSRAALVLALACVLGLNACSESARDTSETPPSWPEPASARSPEHTRMVQALRDLARGASDTNIWVGDARARSLRAELERLPEGASLVERSRLKTNLAEAELKLGNEEEAIRLLRECYEDHFPRVSAGWPPARKRVLSGWLQFSLAVAYMRLGETQNCCRRNSPDSCIMPIRGEGIHANPEGSRRAIDYFLGVLRESNDGSLMHLRARWLLNLAYMTLGEYPGGVPSEYRIPPRQLLPGEPFPRFVNVSRKAGVATFSLSGGAIADDFDNDGYLDLVVSTYAPGGPMRFFHNNRDGSFTDRTRQAGLQGITGGLNLVQADYDNDGWLDILVLRGAWLGKQGQHPNSLLRNDGARGAAQFTDVTFKSGLAKVNHPTQTAAWGDFDNDGDLDLYIGNEADWFDTKVVAAPCQLFRNDGDGSFTDIAASAGVTNDRFAKAVVWGDYDGDRDLDLYVSNFLDANRLYQNKGDGTFRDLAVQAGVTGPHASFPAWFWDFDNDGNLDVYASSWSGDIAALAAAALELPHEAELAALYRGDGRGGFENVAARVGLTRPTGPMGSNFGDLNGDGFADFYLGTGEPELMNLMPNVMYLNHEGKRFGDVTMAGGFGHLQKGHAVVFADLDNDGDIDVFEQMGGAYPGDAFYDALYENPGFGNHWLTLKLVGRESNRSAIGVRIRLDVVDGDSRERTIFRWVNSGGSFGANPLRQTIGLGKATRIRQLELFWPTTGKTQRFSELAMDRMLEITEGETEPIEITPGRPGSGLSPR